MCIALATSSPVSIIPNLFSFSIAVLLQSDFKSRICAFRYLFNFQLVVTRSNFRACIYFTNKTCAALFTRLHGLLELLPF